MAGKAASHLGLRSAERGPVGARRWRGSAGMAHYLMVWSVSTMLHGRPFLACLLDRLLACLVLTGLARARGRRAARSPVGSVGGVRTCSREAVVRPR